MKRRLKLSMVVVASVVASACASPSARAQSASEQRTNCSGASTIALVIASCSAVIELNDEPPENLAIALNNRGIAYGRLGDTARAISDFDQAIRVDPNYAAAFRNRGGAFALQGDYVRALADLDQALRLNPRDVGAYHNRALSYQFQGDYARAVADFDRALELDSRNAETLNGRCWVRVLWGHQLDLALRDCNESLTVHPQNANTLNSRAAVEFRLNDFRASVADYDASFRLAPSMTGSLYGRGVAKLRLGQATEGQADILEATSRDAGVAARYAAFGVHP